MQSNPEHVYSLTELPRPGGDVPHEPFDTYMSKIQAYGSQYPDIYAGAFLAENDIFVGFTTAPEENLRALRKRVGPDAHLKVFKADYSRQTLSELMATIGREMEKWRAQGIQINAASVNEAKNRVEVMLSIVSERAVTALREAYGGNILTFSEGAITPA